jgi:4-amino-4-deoxy-L-arabinose transferase-like glycosyltransferase
MKAVRDNIPVIVFWSVAILLSLCYLGASELWGPEDRWAEVVREMRLTGDYFHPTINGEPYFDKPLMSYWFIALVSAVTGRLDEWTVRFPSVIAGLVALAATMNLGRRLWSKEHLRFSILGQNRRSRHGKPGGHHSGGRLVLGAPR